MYLVRSLRNIVCLLVVLLAVVPAMAATPRILIVGDSWAALESVWESFQTAMLEDGFADWTAKGNVTGIGGSTAAQWVTAAYLDKITQELAANPTIDIVHISLGGNDFLGYVKDTRTQAELDAFYQSVANNLQIIVNHALAQRPDIKVGLQSYDFLDRTQTGMTVQQVNAALLEFTQYVRAVADNTDRCTYLNNYGLMQHTFGVSGVYAPGELAAPGGPPDYLPFAGGDINYPGVAMGDPIHLQYDGYIALARNCLRQQYYEWLGVPQPTVVDISVVEPEPVTAETFHFRVAFSEDVTGLEQEDFFLRTTGGVAGAQVVGLYGTGSVYTVAVNRGMGDGTIALALRSDSAVVSTRAWRKLDPGSVDAFPHTEVLVEETRAVPLETWSVGLALGLCAMAAAYRFRRVWKS